MHDEPFDLRPPKRWPPLADAMRRSLAAGAGRVARLWIEEYVPSDGGVPTSLLLAAELRGYDGDRQLGPEEREEISADLRRRAVEDGDADADRLKVAVFAAGERDELTEHLRETEPVFGEPTHRFMNLAQMRQLLATPRVLPKPEPVRKDQVGASDALIVAVIALVLAAGVAALAWWLFAADWIGWTLGLLIAVPGLGLAAITYLGSTTAAVRPAKPLRTLPMTLAVVVQAFEALWVADHPDYPHGARFGLVAVFSLDPQRRDDLAWLSWLARRLAWLRDNGADDPDETRLAQRLEGEADDGTSRLPPSVTGNDATYWISPHYTRDDLPGERLPEDRILPILLERGATAGAERVAMARPWPAELWPLRYRPPWENRPDVPERAM